MANNVCAYQKLTELLNHFSDQFRNTMFDGYEEIRTDYENTFPGKNLNMCDIYDVVLEVPSNPINRIYIIEYPESRTGDYRDCIIPSNNGGYAYLHFVCNSIRRPSTTEDIKMYIRDCFNFAHSVISWDSVFSGRKTFALVYNIINYLNILDIYTVWKHIQYAYPKQPELLSYEIWEDFIGNICDGDMYKKRELYDRLCEFSDNKKPWNANVIIGQLLNF